MGKWIRIAVVLAVLAIIVWIAVGIGGGLISLLRGAELEGERDPMFAEEAEMVTRPPELYAEETQKPHKTLDDYIMEESAPVDKTARELIEEAQGA